MKIVVFTGAGVSRESGLKTFRDSVDGLWENYRIEDVASIEGWHRDPKTVLDFYNMRRREVINAVPNRAHVELASLESKHDVTIITQNIDDLHERAGSSKVIHLHGEILKVRPEDGWDPISDWREDLNLGDLSEEGTQLRPHIVWFGEGLPEFDHAYSAATARDVDALIVAGTSLAVFPASLIALDTKASKIFLVDPEPPAWNARGLELVKEVASTGVAKVVEELMR